MAKPSIKSLKDDAIVARYAGYSKLRRNKDDDVIGVLHTAFELRPNEEYLSAAHLDHFSGSKIEKLSAMKMAYDPHPLQVKPNGAFTLGEVGKIKSCCATFAIPVRIVNAPSKNLDCYVQVRQFKDDIIELLNTLSEETWCDFIVVKDIPNNP